LADVRRADARSAQIGGPDGISQLFHFTTNSGEPLTPSRACNLLSKHDWRAALGDELGEDGPEVPGVVEALAFAGGAERLAGARRRPDRLIDGPAGELEGVGPAADAGEEVALGEAGDFACSQVGDRSLIDFAIGDQAFLGEPAEPFRGAWVVVVVEVGHSTTRSVRALPSIQVRRPFFANAER
jgi:hypothetical protein